MFIRWQPRGQIQSEFSWIPQAHVAKIQKHGDIWGWYLKSAQKCKNRANEREMVTKNMETASHPKGSLKAIQNTAERYTRTDLKSGSMSEFRNREKTHKLLTEKKFQQVNRLGYENKSEYHQPCHF